MAGPWTSPLPYELLGQADRHEQTADGVTARYDRYGIITTDGSDEFATKRADRTTTEEGTSQ
ncbi:hypothetical protein [Streptomyces sirii]|uniref:hypothetical protein n=1 Tax=Streptomyces sirii TaxID=3127701 RepID=UPI003D36C861